MATAIHGRHWRRGAVEVAAPSTMNEKAVVAPATEISVRSE